MPGLIIIRLFTVLAIVSMLASGVWAQQSQGYKGYARGAALITAKELKHLIDAKDPKLVILAAENDLEYRLGHIPGSHQVDRPVYEAPPETQGGITGNIIDAAGFTKLAKQLGIDKNSKVVVYDTKYDATRLWWAFFYYGKADVRVLDGASRPGRRAATIQISSPTRSLNMDHLSPRSPFRIFGSILQKYLPCSRTRMASSGTTAIVKSTVARN